MVSLNFPWHFYFVGPTFIKTRWMFYFVDVVMLFSLIFVSQI